MVYTVTVGDDEVAELVRQSLEQSIDMNVRSCDGTEEGMALLASMMLVHQYYSTKDQHDAIMGEYGTDIERVMRQMVGTVEGEDSNSFDVDTIENEDGSLTISFDASDAEIHALASKGVEYNLLLSIFGNPDPEQLIRWVERGKQEEKTDEIMKRFDEAKAQTESEEYVG